jgi:hypothetical protein
MINESHILYAHREPPIHVSAKLTNVAWVEAPAPQPDEPIYRNLRGPNPVRTTCTHCFGLVLSC